jgi:aromatic-amino-acid transaminase
MPIAGWGKGGVTGGSGLLLKSLPHRFPENHRVFQKVDAYAGDPILSLMERFKEDPRSDKVNLSIGLYYNEDGIIPQLQAVAEAEARLNAVPHGASLYLPMEGLNAYRNTIAPLLFGPIIRCLRKNASPPSRRWAARVR